MSASIVGVPKWVCETTGATQRQLDYWARTGLLDVGEPGSGKPRDWNPTAIANARLIIDGLALGLTLERLRALVAWVNEQEERPLNVWLMPSWGFAAHPRYDESYFKLAVPPIGPARPEPTCKDCGTVVTVIGSGNVPTQCIDCCERTHGRYKANLRRSRLRRALEACSAPIEELTRGV